MSWKTFAAEVGEQPAPGFALPSHQGRTIRREDYRQKAPLVLFFGHGAECAACQESLRLLNAHYRAIREHDAEVLALLSGDASGIGARFIASLPFPVLTDANGAAAAAYTPLLGQPGPGLVVLDRFGAARAAFTGHLVGDTLDEALAWLELMSYECPE